jgi:CheY-like chemotaxis protein
MGTWQTIVSDMRGVPRASQRLRIFVVEDDPDSLHTLCLYLRYAGYSVRSARSKEEALNEIPNAKCDVFISDLRLSDGNGWDLIREMGKLRPRCAIAISGYGTKADREKSAKVGFRYHLVKPVSSEELAAVLEEAGAELRER